MENKFKADQALSNEEENAFLNSLPEQLATRIKSEFYMTIIRKN